MENSLTLLDVISVAFNVKNKFRFYCGLFDYCINLYIWLKGLIDVKRFLSIIPTQTICKMYPTKFFSSLKKAKLYMSRITYNLS